MKLGLVLAWHSLRFEELLEMARLAERLGYAELWVDGDVSMLPSRGEAPVLDGWTVTTALLARTERIAIGSIRLVHHWHAAKLAQAVVTQQALHPGRSRFLISVGGQPADARFGLTLHSAAERVRWLDEMLEALRGLWRGDCVTLRGEYVRLEGARVRPVPPGGRIPIAVAAQGRRMLRLVARHADRWDVNAPALPARVAPLEAELAAACRAQGRDPAAVERSMWIFARPGCEPGAALRAEWRRWQPWFAGLADAEIDAAVLAGPPERCREALAERARALRLDVPCVDLSGLPLDAARQSALELAPDRVMAAAESP